MTARTGQSSDLLAPRNAYPGDRVHILRRQVETSIGTLPVGAEVTPLYAGQNSVTDRYEHVWGVGGRRVVYADAYDVRPIAD